MNFFESRAIVATLVLVALRILSPLALAFAATSAPPELKSSFDAIKGSGAVSGWVSDPAGSSASISISIYMDGPEGVGELIGAVTAAALRADVDAILHVADARGYSWQIPSAYRNQTHFWYVYATRAGGVAEPLAGSPRVYPAIAASLIGGPQTVYAYATDKCDSIDIPDSPARAYRDAAGKVNLIASHFETRRAVGDTLDEVAHRCAIVHHSRDDRSFDAFRYHEWLHAFYTLDGTTVYSSVHNEWYGNLVDAACGSDMIDGWVSASTLAISRDGGATYRAPEDYLVRYPTTPWNNSFPCDPEHATRYGDFGGTNIIARNGYYYKFFAYNSDPSIQPHRFGECLMRTKDLATASSWEIFDGQGFIRSKTAPCAFVANMKAAQSVTYNKYLRLYVATVALSGGFEFSVSPDLVNWSALTPISTNGLDISKAGYPSLLDPTDTSRNFEYTGQTPYLYFVQNHGGLDRDLDRAQIRFSGLPFGAEQR